MIQRSIQIRGWLIGTDSWFAELSLIGKNPFRVASVAGVVENGLLSLYSTRAPSRGGNHWQHVLFVLACDTARCTERETPDSHLNTADRKSCHGTEHHSHSFLLNYIMYITMIWDKYNDFTLGELLCIVHFSAKRLSFCDSNTVCMLHIESCNTDRAFLFTFALFFFLNTELQTHLCHIVHSWSKLMSVWWLNKPFWTVAWIECDASGVCDTCDFSKTLCFCTVCHLCFIVTKFCFSMFHLFLQ